ncbi:MAG: 2-amino-4-hydroxy-6-hydroxymethyldihydropteridine diphosphokinase [Endomicrobium sp.]|jgi:2-amino-4-hydroxy-6-hydroxymethyldihydropteridine diphosphokinase|nr:2-amino-4-hydroxy-6-hydroxymethyldihydropteridine diphosphokinase [Endomicrobium sp.]
MNIVFILCKAIHILYNKEMKVIYLSLGSNIGNRAENLVSALSFLQSSGFVNILKISSFYKTSAVGLCQRDFYNIAVKAETNLQPEELLCLVQNIEFLIGRKPSKRWGPRIIDIDILFFGNEIVKADNLFIPHKEIQNRLFALCPLNEISPDFVHPVLNRKINEIVQESRLTLKCQKVKIIAI